MFRMKYSCTLHLEVVTVVAFVLIPWYGPIAPRPFCQREKASLVRKVVIKKWMPILEKVGAALPLECPLHPARDIFTLQESRKRHVSPQWTCGFCGKSFFHEVHLDSHMENKHPDKLNNREDTVCLADFCDVMRCEVLQERLMELEELTPTATALDIWHKPLLISSSKKSHYPGDQALERAIPRSLMRATTNAGSWPPIDAASGRYSSKFSSGSSKTSPSPFVPTKPKSEPERSASKEHSKVIACRQSDETCKYQEEPHNENRTPSDGPTELPIHPLHSWRDTCNDEHLAEIRVKCQQLIQQCVSGLVLNLTLDQVRDVEAALQRAVCWYLTCERYWEAGAMEPPEFPWVIVSAFVLLLTLGVTLCYYIVWVLCESTQDSAVCTPVSNEQPKFSSHSSNNAGGFNMSSTPSTTSGPLVLGGQSRGSSLGRSGASASRARYCATESESECRDSGFNEGGLYPEYDSSEIHDANSYRSRHYSEDSRLSLPPDDANPRYYVHEERVYNYASTFTPNYEQKRLRRNRYNYLDDFDAYSEIDGEGVESNAGLNRERSDSFIYVSYPPEVKKRFQENR